MARVRITHVESFKVFAPGVRPNFAWREGLRGGPVDGLVAVLCLRTDDGVAGVAATQYRGSALVFEDLVGRVLREELVGTDPLERERIWHRMWELDRTEEFPIWLIGLVDCALWDLAGRLYGSPTWEVLGGFRREIPAYASTSTFASVGEYLEVVTQCIELGYPAIKLHAWGDARRDAALCAAVPRTCRRKHPAHVRRLGRLRPRGCCLRRRRTFGGPLPLVRGADARIQRNGLQVARRSSERALEHRRDL